MLAWRVGDLFVDVGSNVGSYTIWVGESGAEAIASERPEDAFCLLRENVALNGYPSRLTQMGKCAAEWSREFFCSALYLREWPQSCYSFSFRCSPSRRLAHSRRQCGRGRMGPHGFAPCCEYRAL